MHLDPGRLVTGAVSQDATTGTTYKVLAGCRICGSGPLSMVLSLGETPLANSFVTADRLHEAEPMFPLELMRCTECGLVQLSVVVDPELMFRHYVYMSSASAPLRDHFDNYASEVAQMYAPDGSLVVEVGSNDGLLLSSLRRRGVAAVGIEPSVNLALAANGAGLETWNEFFTVAVAERLRSARGPAQAVLANNVIAHIDDLRGFAAAVTTLLDDRGVLIVEFPHVLSLLDHVEYDTIYHEHLSYLAGRPLRRLFHDFGLEPIAAERIATHGGSLRIVFGRVGTRPVTDSIAELERSEAAARLDSVEPYLLFADRVRRSKEALVEMLRSARMRGQRIAALGATAKGNTLLNYCGIGPDVVEYIADTTSLKQGLYAPGTHIPVLSDSVFERDRPDLTLLLAWNYADWVLRKHESYLAAGGRFINPIPIARLIP